MATNFNYRIIVKTTTGYQKFGASDCHTAKSVAGRLFHNNNVKSVTVANILGIVFLYLVKNEPAKTVNIPSELAENFIY